MTDKQLNLFELDDEFSIYSLLVANVLPNENFEVEYKSATQGFPREFWKTYSAFANTVSGIIVLGVNEKRTGFTIEGLTSNQRLQYVLNMHSADITTLLKKLCANYYLESDNNGRWTTYKLKEKVASSEKVATSTEHTDNQVNSSKKVASSNPKVDTSNKVATSLESADNQTITQSKVDTSDAKVDTSNAKVDTSDMVATRTKLSKAQLEEKIMRICQSDYIKMEEVATILRKSVDYLKNKVFPDMIKAGKLEKRFPFTHNHPEQGYKTAEKYAKEL